jgi:hypothetical protein
VRRSWVAPAALVVVTVIVGGDAAFGHADLVAPPFGSRSSTASAGPYAAALESAVAIAQPSATTVPSLRASAGPSATAPASLDPATTPDRPPAGDIATALASQSAWVSDTSTAYRFTVQHPSDWEFSETSPNGWAYFRGWDDSNLSVTWRSTATGATLKQITGEVWQALEESGYTVQSSHPSTISGLPARLIVANGRSPLGHQRHGIVGILVTGGGRYRVELWTNPGTEADDLALYRAFISTFVPA